MQAVASKKTVFRYLDILEKLLLAKVLYFIEPDEASFNYSKQRKVHLTDPLVYSAMASWCMTERPDDSVLAESIVASTLSKHLETGYWSNSREVDIVAKSNRGRELLGLEVKYRHHVSPLHLSVGRMKNVLTLSRLDFEPERSVIPVSIFLALLP